MLFLELSDFYFCFANKVEFFKAILCWQPVQWTPICNSYRMEANTNPGCSINFLLLGRYPVIQDFHAILSNLRFRYPNLSLMRKNLIR